MLFCVALAMTGHSQTVSITGNRFTVNGQPIWFNGINTPWHNWADFGGNFTPSWWRDEFQRYVDNRINLARVWIHCDGSNNPATNPDGSVTGVNVSFWAHMDSLVAISKEKKVYILPCLWSFDMVKNTNTSTYQRYRNLVNSQANIQSYIDNFLIPLIQRYDNEPYILGWEICNEPEWMFKNAENGPMPKESIQRLHAMCAAAVHKNCTKPVTTGSSCVKWNSPLYEGTGDDAGNVWSAAALQAVYNDPDAFMDFYQIHWYPWMTQWFYSPFQQTTQFYQIDDRPVLVGETEGMNVCDSYVCQTLVEMYENSYLNGFDGVCGWKTPQNDGHGTLANITVATTAFYSNHPALVYPGAGEHVPATGVTVTPSTVTLNVNNTTHLTATVSPANATDKSVTWSSSNPAVATVNTSGTVTGISEGTASITANTVDGGFTASSSVTVTGIVATQYTITTSVTGSGTVTLNPPGGTYDAGTQVTITASPAAGFQFDHWSGGLSGSTNPLTVTLNNNLSAIANFSEITETNCDNPKAITLPFQQNGAGEFCWVTSGNISFINSWNLTLLEINGADFTNKWSNAMPARIGGNYYIHYVASVGWAHAEINGSGGDDEAEQFTITTSVTGTGSVALNPPGGIYDEGASVTLTATPASGFQFANWSGGMSSSTNPATVTVNANLSVTANFTEVTEPDQFTLSTSVNGSGAVTLSPPGGVYDEGTVLILTATPAANFDFARWSGDVTGAVNPVSITMDGNKSVTATFTPSDTDDSTCANPVTITLPFAHDGAGEFCFVTTGNISYINSWNMTLVEVNGVNFTNVWSNSLPSRIDGAYYIHFVGPFGWSHFEAAGSNAGARVAFSKTTAPEQTETVVYPNPVLSGGRFTVDLTDAAFHDHAIISITDLQGKEVFRGKANSQKHMQVETPLPAGMYQVTITGSDGRVTHKKVLIK